MPKVNKKWIQYGILLTIGLIIGTAFVFQSKSVNEATQRVNREVRINIFKEIEVLLQSNEDLRMQIDKLEEEKKKGSDRENAIANLKKQRELYQILLGEIDVKGQGVLISIDQNLQALWFTDLINELYTSGAEVISINGKRYADPYLGFDNMPNGQILFGEEMIIPPYEIKAIGDTDVLYSALNQSGGFVDRINKFLPEHQIEIEKQTNMEISVN